MNYLTIAKPIKAELDIKKSRFIGILMPLQDVNQFETSIQELRMVYPGANHYCYALVVKQNDAVLERCSDDGEPSGTAGWPMLGVLKNKGLQNVLAVVIRFFGGTLLGTGGLVRAYTGAVQSALDAARLVLMEYSQKIAVSLEYSYYGGFQKQFAELWNRVGDVLFTERVRIEIWISFEEVPSFVARIDDLTGGTASIERREEGFFPKQVY